MQTGTENRPFAGLGASRSFALPKSLIFIRIESSRIMFSGLRSLPLNVKLTEQPEGEGFIPMDDVH
jgi:hypothetical protein